MGEPDLAQQIQLEKLGARRVFFLDIGKYMVPIGFILQPGQVLAVTVAHELPDSAYHNTTSVPTSQAIGVARSTA